MTRQQLFDFFTKNPGMDIVDEEGVHHHYAFWLKHRLDFLHHQEEHWLYESQQRPDISVVSRHYAEQELNRTRREIRRLLGAGNNNGTVTLQNRTPEKKVMPFIETAWRAVTNFVGGSR